MKRLVMMAVAILLALVLAAPVVSAQGRGGAPEEVEGSIDLPIPEAPFASCEFPVRYQFSGKSKTIRLPGGRTIFTSPGLTATLTNRNTGQQVRLNITGAFHQSVLENGNVETVVTGRNLLGDPEAGFVLAKGRFSFVFDAEGNLVQPLSGKGTLTDVCGLLE